MAEKFLTQEQLSVFCSSLAMLLRSGASLSEVSSLFEEDGMDTALRQASTEISLSVAAGETFSARWRCRRIIWTFRQRRKRPAFSRNTP